MMAPFAVERAPTVALYCLRKHRSVHVAMLTDYPVRFQWLYGFSLTHRQGTAVVSCDDNLVRHMCCLA